MSGSTTRRAVVLILIVAGLLLAAPVGASAGVKAKYKREYKAKLDNWRAAFASEYVAYGDVIDEVDRVASAEAPLVGDPDQHDKLVYYETYALTCYTNLSPLPSKWLAHYVGVVNKDAGRMSRWFTSRSDREAFQEQVDEVLYAFKRLRDAMDNVHHAFKYLSSDPPYFEGQVMDLMAGKLKSDDAVAVLEKALGQLLAMR